MALKVRENDPPTPRSTRRKVAKSLANKGRRQDDQGRSSDSDEEGQSSGSNTSDEDTDSEDDEASTPPKRKIRAFLGSKSASSQNQVTTPKQSPQPAKQIKRPAKWSSKENTD